MEVHLPAKEWGPGCMRASQPRKADAPSQAVGSRTPPPGGGANTTPSAVQRAPKAEPPIPALPHVLPHSGALLSQPWSILSTEWRGLRVCVAW